MSRALEHDERKESFLPGPWFLLSEKKRLLSEQLVGQLPALSQQEDQLSCLPFHDEYPGVGPTINLCPGVQDDPE